MKLWTAKEDNNGYNSWLIAWPFFPIFKETKKRLTLATKS
jgi:hypothetical protein